MSEFLRKNAPIMRAALDNHNGSCRIPARAILLHPAEHQKLSVEVLWGLVVLPDERVRPGYFRVDCEGSAWDIEQELAFHMNVPVEEPTTVPLEPVEPPVHRSQAG